MSDYREVQHGFDMFNRYFLDAAKRNAFVEAFDACTPGAANDAFTAFNNWWQDLRLNTYIACVSEHQDSEDVYGRLSMWRAFGVSGTRVGIVLRFPYISASAMSLALTVPERAQRVVASDLEISILGRCEHPSPLAERLSQAAHRYPAEEPAHD